MLIIGKDCCSSCIGPGPSYNSRGAPDLDPDPAGYPVFLLGSGRIRILKYEDLAKSGSGWIQTVWIRSTGFITM